MGNMLNTMVENDNSEYFTSAIAAAGASSHWSPNTEDIPEPLRSAMIEAGSSPKIRIEELREMRCYETLILNILLPMPEESQILDS